MAGTTNMIPWNPTGSNQENDTQYAADSQRAGGATNPSLFDATLANKLFYQMSTYLTALFTAFANKGYTTSDSNLSTLVSQCANFLTTGDVLPPQVEVAFSSTPIFDASLSNGFRIDLSGSVTSSTIVNHVAGRIYTFYIVSIAPGVYTFAWPGNVVDPPNVQTQSLGNLLVYQCISDGSNLFPVPTQLLFLQGEIDTTNTVLAATNTALSTVEGEIAALVTRSATVTNGNGSYYQWSDGLKEVWGLSPNGSGTGVNRTSMFVAFPVTFNSPPVVVCSPNNNPDGYGPAAFGCYPTNITTTGFTANLCAGVTIGGSGPANINNSIHINFVAKGV